MKKRKQISKKVIAVLCLVAMVMVYLPITSKAAGISIDSSFEDWDSVAKTSITHSNIQSAAVVWDGDTVYLYAQEQDGKDCSFTWGQQFQFLTSDGQTVNFSANLTSWNWHEPTKDLAISGVSDASGKGQFVASKNSYQWEVSFPAAAFGTATSISLANTNGQVLIADITKSGVVDSTEEATTEAVTTEKPSTTEAATTEKPSTTEDVIPGGPIIIDGFYDDWKGIDRSDAFTWYSNNKLCSHYGGILMDEDKVYVHVKLNELYLAQIPLTSFNLTINGEQTISFGANYKNSDNTINYNGNVYDLPVGTTMLGIFDQQGNKQYLGDLAVTIGTKNPTMSNGEQIKDPVDEFEFAADLETLSKLTGIPVESIKSISFSCQNLGGDSITTSGTSTGTYIGVILCIIITGGILYIRKRKQVISK